MTMKEIRRISITDATVDSIKGLIESEQYKIGEKLPTEATLYQSMKVSRTSVREAVRILQALGYIINIPGKVLLPQVISQLRTMKTGMI